MTGALILLAVLVVTGLVLYALHRRDGDAEGGERVEGEEREERTAESGERSEGCCGLHEVCEKDTLLLTGDEPEYFDDEELDRFAGRDPKSYSAEETEELREVMMTLRSDDVAPWARSIAARGIALPDELRDELLMLVDEVRQANRPTLPPA